LCNGGNFEGIFDSMDLCCIVDDVCAKTNPGQVPKKNLPGNCGPSLLFTGSQSQQQKTTSQFAEPIMFPDSKRYAPLYVKITKDICKMAAHQVSLDQDPFPVISFILLEIPSRQKEWADQAREVKCTDS
jgi:hypothetical protein